jgi:hypothetical protein
MSVIGYARTSTLHQDAGLDATAAFVIHGAPQIHPSTADLNHYFVEMQSLARRGAALPQSARDHRAEFKHSPPHSLQPMLCLKFLEVAIGQSR